MRTELKLFNASIKDLVSIFLLSFIIMNGLSYLIFTLMMGKPFIEFFQRNWLIFTFVPLIQGIIQSLTNRNGLLTIEKEVNSEVMKNKVDYLLKKMDYNEKRKDNKVIQYFQKSKWKKLMNIIFDKRLEILYEIDSIKIFGKKEILTRLESKLKSEQYIN